MASICVNTQRRKVLTCQRIVVNVFFLIIFAVVFSQIIVLSKPYPSKPVKTCYIYQANIEKPFKCTRQRSLFTRANSTEFTHFCHRYLLMRLCHMLQFTRAFFLSLTSQIWHRKIARANVPLIYWFSYISTICFSSVYNLCMLTISLNERPLNQLLITYLYLEICSEDTGRK